jgi:hypothetical protein
MKVYEIYQKDRTASANADEAITEPLSTDTGSDRPSNAVLDFCLQDAIALLQPVGHFSNFRPKKTPPSSGSGGTKCIVAIAF